MLPTRTPLVFLHGLGGGHHYGHSETVEPYDLEQVALSLRRLIDALGGEPVVLVGHSMGGLIAQEVYARFPDLVKALALCFTSAAFVGDSSFAREFVAARVGPLAAGKSMAEIAASVMPAMHGSKADPEGLAHARKIMSGISPETYGKAVRLLTTFDRREQVPSIAVPALLIAGSDDKTAPASIMKRMAEKIPGAEYVLLEGCGHLGPLDQPEAFNAALEGFLIRRKL